MSATFKFDTSKFERALKAFAAESRKSARDVLLSQAKLFVRDVVSVTPPNKDGKISPRAGVTMVRSDFKKIMRPVRLAKNNPAVVHKRFRDKRGRVRADFRGNGGRDRRWAVSKPRLDSALKKKLANVGMLASGWVAAARKLGARLPTWITRHGAKFGSVRIGLSRVGMSVRVVNSVPFVGNVTGMQRRVQWALNNRARQMDKQLEAFALKRAARQAGL